MRKPIPVLLMTRELGIGGCERDLTKLALGFDRARFEPHVFCFTAGGFRGEELLRAGVPVTELSIRSFLSAAFVGGLRQMSQYIKRHGIQIIHALDVPANLLASAVRFVRRVPVVITSQLGSRDLYDRRAHRMVRLTDRISDLIVVNSDAMRQALIRQEGIAAERIAVCYNGVDQRDFHPPPGFVADREILPPALRDASVIIGTVAALRPEKDLATLLEAFTRVQHQREGMRLAIVGNGPMLEPWKAVAQRLQITPLCHFEPATPRVADWMRAFDIFVLCSLSESFSNSLLEAMACGCCPIASRVGGLPEMISEEETGLLIEPGNPEDLAAKLARVIGDQELRCRLARNAAARAQQRFSVEAFVRNTEEIYLSRFRKVRPDWFD